MNKIATLAAVTVLGLAGPFAALGSASAAPAGEQDIVWRHVTSFDSYNAAKLCFHTITNVDHQALRDLGCTEPVQINPTTWAASYQADTSLVG